MDFLTLINQFMAIYHAINFLLQLCKHIKSISNLSDNTETGFIVSNIWTEPLLKKYVVVYLQYDGNSTGIWTYQAHK